MTPPTKDKVYIDFVGKGDIQKSVTQGADINANTGLGVIFERFGGYDKFIQSFELEGTMNIASTSDTIVANAINNEIDNRRDFGGYILNPISTNQALFVNSNIYLGQPTKKNKLKGFANISKVISGVNFRVISSNNVWTSNDTSTNLGALAFRAGIFHEFIPDNYRLTEGGRSKYSIFLGLNYTYRGLYV